MASIKISLLLLCIISIFFAAGCVQSEENGPASPQETPSEQPATDVTEYVACGCGCCGGAEESVYAMCLYRSKGDDMQKIIDYDKNASRSPQCATAGCSQPMRVVYCDDLTTEANDKSNINSTTFFVFQDGKKILQGPISIDDVDIPLNEEEICIVARKSCNSPSCLRIMKPAELSENVAAVYEQSFGKFDWLVSLEPVCGPTTAYINENEKSVVCFCALE